MDLIDKIKNNYSWLNKKNQDIIIGDDIDAIMSACFLHDVLNWNIIGFYVDYSKLFIKKGYKKWKNAVFVDLDISNNDIKSIGHHILKLNDEAENCIGQLKSINPNLIRKISMKNFNQKYPLATIHFLQWLYSNHIEINDDIENLIWIPDSSWINGQSHRYRKNMLDWIEFFNLKNLKKSFKEIDKKSFEEMINKKIIPLIKNTGFLEGRSQISSRYYKIKGYQCQFKNPVKDSKKINNLIDTICNIYNWKKPIIPKNYDLINGCRKNADIRTILINNDLSSFIKDNNVFSYVIPNYNRINYTIM